jgi:cytochrome c-type biogenesis protein CcmF
MQFEGEHLLPGQLGHLLVIIALVSSVVATFGYVKAAQQTDLLQKASWLRFSRMAFILQMAMNVGIFILLLIICSNHYFEYLYAYKHSSKELEYKYLLACIWEDQSGSFLLWSLWHSVLGCVLIKKSKEWEAPVMTVLSLAQAFLAVMMLGIYFFGVRIGNNPFALTRNEIAGPIFSQPNYLNFIKDGVGLNILLRNYWMVIHPPILFLGFASTIVPFAYAYAGLQTKRFGDWVKPAIAWTLFSACVLGVGIMMGGKWAYESLSFGGYWAWDPVENASMVPWLLLIAGLHTMVIYKATGHSLRTSYIFVFLSFVFILYSTFLTRTGILGDTSVHSFTEAGNAMYMLLLLFLGVFTLGSFALLAADYKKIPAIHQEENINSREFWMFIGSLVFFITAIFIIAKTSLPVVNKMFGTRLAQPEDVEFSYNRIVVFTAIIVGLLTAIVQYMKYKSTPASYTLKKIAVPTLVALAAVVLIAVFYPLQYRRNPPNAVFTGVLYLALFATLYAAIANTHYIFSVLKGKMKAAGSALSHAGFALMLAGMIITSGNKKTISDNRVTGINLRMGMDPQTKQEDNPLENLTLIRQVPTRMGPYEVTYLKDSMGLEKGRKFYQLLFEQKDPATKAVSERFFLYPDVYMMKNNTMSSNPDTRMYASKDVFTYISYASNDKQEDTASFKVQEVNVGDTLYYSKGYIILKEMIKNPATNKFNLPNDGATVMADLAVVSKDSMHYRATPLIQVHSPEDIHQLDDTVYAQNLYLRFVGIGENNKIKIGVKESDKLIDFIALKAYIFPYINLVWVGLVIMALGLLLSMVNRLQWPKGLAYAALGAVAVALFYMFLFAN